MRNGVKTPYEEQRPIESANESAKKAFAAVIENADKLLESLEEAEYVMMAEGNNEVAIAISDFHSNANNLRLSIETVTDTLSRNDG